MTVLLDSMLLIDHFNGVREATTYLREMQGESSISVMTRAEVLSGFDAAQAAAALPLLDRFPMLPVERDAADLAARLQREERWRLADALQAALVKLHGLKLSTRNTRDFPPERYDFVVVPYRI